MTLLLFLLRLEFDEVRAMIDAMDNATNLTMSVNKEVSDMMNTNEQSNIQFAIFCVIIILNVIMNSLVIAVIARYPQLREDRTTLFMFSLSVSDLAAGCTYMPISVVLCYGARPGVADIVGFFPKLQLFALWWFSFNSMHSLCWVTISKAILIMKPFEAEQLLTRKRCYVIIALIWTVGCLLATVNFSVHVTVNAVSCTYSIPANDHVVKAGYLTFFVIGVVLPISLIIYGTVRILIVVVRTHRQISALEQSVAVGDNSNGNTGFVTVQAIRSSKSVIVICIVSLLLNTPTLAYAVLDNVTDTHLPYMFNFVCIRIFESNTFVNSLLYLILFKSVRQKVVLMSHAVIVYLCARR